MQTLKIMLDDGAEIPEYAHDGDAGMDLRAAGSYTIPCGKSVLASTGVHAEIPKGYVGLVFPRSGLGAKGITMRNCVGVIDSGYRGEIKCALWNTMDKKFEVSKGDRICQLVIMPYERCEIMLADSLDDSERGENGYGSTGVK